MEPDVDRIRADLVTRDFAGRIAQDIDSADRSKRGRHDGPQDLPTLTRVIQQTLATAT